MQIQFTTRSGTNVFTGSGYHFYQSDKLNTNTLLQQACAACRRAPRRCTSPASASAARSSSRASTTAAARCSSSSTTKRTARRARSRPTRRCCCRTRRTGIFRYNGGPARAASTCYALAAANGHIATPDPIDRASCCTDIRDLDGERRRRRSRDHRQPERRALHVPAAGERPDAVPDDPHGLQPVADAPPDRLAEPATILISTPDTTNTRAARSGRASRSPARSCPIRYTSSGVAALDAVAEPRQRSARRHESAARRSSRRTSTPRHVQRPARQPGRLRARHQRGGHHATPAPAAAISAREADDASSSTNTLNWLKGAHSLSLGGDVHAGRRLARSRETRAPSITLRHADRRSRARRMFTRGELPGQLDGERNTARALYAVLTGRVTLDQRHGAPRRRHRPVRLQRRQPPGRPAAPVRLLHPGQLAGASRTCR